MRLRTSVLGTAKLENERLFLFGYCIRVENMLISYAYACTHTLLKITELPHGTFCTLNLFLQQNTQGKLFFPGHTGNMTTTGAVSFFFFFF